MVLISLMRSEWVDNDNYVYIITGRKEEFSFYKNYEKPYSQTFWEEECSAICSAILVSQH
jgi:hypothetical protein